MKGFEVAEGFNVTPEFLDQMEKTLNRGQPIDATQSLMLCTEVRQLWMVMDRCAKCMGSAPICEDYPRCITEDR